MRPHTQKAIWLVAGLFLAVAIAQSSSPGGSVHPGQPENCNGWHTVVKDDNCQSVSQRYGISLEQFLKWNPAVSSDCRDNFWIDSAYCVRIGQSSSRSTTAISSTSTSKTTISSKPTSQAIVTSVPTTPTTSYNSTYSIMHPVTSWNLSTTSTQKTWPPTKTLMGQIAICNAWHRVVPVTLPTADSSFAPTPSHGPMPSNCKVFHQVSADQNCNDLVSLYGYFSQQEFMAWNPALDGNCLGLWLDTWYCIGAYSDGDLPLPAHQTMKPTEGNIPSGYPSDCARWYRTTFDDTCDDVTLMFGSFSMAEFAKWNPSVFSDCSGIVSDAWYCIGRPGTPTTRTSGAPSLTRTIASTQPATTATAAPQPVQTPSLVREGMTEDCVKFHLQQPGDLCWSMASGSGISLDQFYKWNPAVGSDCQNLWPDYYYCVGV